MARRREVETVVDYDALRTEYSAARRAHVGAVLAGNSNEAYATQERFQSAQGAFHAAVISRQRRRVG